MRIYEIAPGQKSRINILKNRNRDAEEIDDAKLDKLASLIQTQCGDAISYYKKTGHVLFRGLQDEGGDEQWIFKGRSRKDRQPYSDADIVNIFNTGFAQAKIKANRTNTIACTTFQAATEVFGDPFVIFPKNGFQFSESEVNDFGTQFMEEGNHWVEHYKQNPIQAIEDYGYTGTNFAGALKSGNEVNICGEYYALMKDSYIGMMVIRKVMGE